MLSSRNEDTIQFGGAPVPLSQVRQECVRQLDGAKIFGEAIIAAWINENAVEDAAGNTSRTSLERIDDTDLVIVFYNGRAGWAPSGSSIGICHAELHRAMSTAPAKVFLIDLPRVTGEAKDRARDDRFREYVSDLKIWRETATSGEEAIACANRAVVQGITKMVHRGVVGAKREAGTIGEALDWEKLGMAERSTRMDKSAKDFLSKLPIADTSSKSGTILQLEGTKMLLTVNAVPEALSFAPARESVGQVFRNDHLLLPSSDNTLAGPIHIVLVHRSATRTQARNLLGVDDSTCFDTPFGVFASDEYQKIQLVIITDCRDDASTRQGLQNWLDWMQQTGEGATLARRATRRAEIVRAIQQANR